MLANDAGNRILLKNWKGRSYSDASTPHWNAIKAVQHDDGFQVLCEGEGKREGRFSWMSVNADGRINGQSQWQSANASSTQQWERIFGDLIQRDGVIGEASDDDGNGFLDHHRHYQIYAGGRSAPLTGKNGRTLSKKNSKSWNALKAISTNEGFEVLIGSKGRKQQRFRVLDVDLDGQVNQKTPWMKGAKALFAGWNTQFRNLLLAKNSKGGVKAASTGGDDPAGQLIYTATADDTSNVTYALKDEGQGFDGVLTIDQNSGEVRLIAEKLKEILNDISFKIITTDIAGNSSEWPVTVTLNHRERSEDNGDAGSDSTAGEIGALSVDESIGLTPETAEALTDDEQSYAEENATDEFNNSTNEKEIEPEPDPKPEPDPETLGVTKPSAPALQTDSDS